VIVGQNYANNTIFMTLSTVETIMLKLDGVDDRDLSQRKTFGNYDTIDFSRKNVNELLVQLHGQIMCLRASMQCFEYQYKGQFKYPKDYDETELKKFILTAKNFFNKIDNQVSSGALDLIKDI
jgi:hypothetical protein